MSNTDEFNDIHKTLSILCSACLRGLNFYYRFEASVCASTYPYNYKEESIATHYRMSIAELS